MARIEGYRLIPKALGGVTFIDGEPADEGEQVAEKMNDGMRLDKSPSPTIDDIFY